MRYKTFQNAGAEVSALAVGTWSIGGDNYGQVDRDEAIAAIRAMIEHGVNLVDTAPVYGNGASEKIVGEALGAFPRDKVLISTKVGLVTDIYTKGAVRDASYKNIMREIESSLKNLRTDYIDFYYIHWPDLHTPLSETMAALNYLRDQKIIRYVGVSNFSREQIEEAERYGRIDVQQPPFSMVNQDFIDLMRWGHQKGIDAMTYGSMGAGILSGAIREIPDFAPNDIRMTFYDYYKEPKFSKIMTLLQTMDRVAAAHQVPVSQVAINWSTQKDFVGTALVGVLKVREAVENCAAFDWSLTREEMELLDAELDRLHINQP